MPTGRSLRREPRITAPSSDAPTTAPLDGSAAVQKTLVALTAMSPGPQTPGTSTVQLHPPVARVPRPRPAAPIFGVEAVVAIEPVQLCGEV
jgi:hypothetical protein